MSAELKILGNRGWGLGDGFSIPQTQSPIPFFINELGNCKQCPRECGVNRYSKKLGYCKSDASFNISSICVHKGEEPVVSGENGICNVFFSSCNLQCIYCQNYQISQHKSNNESRPFDLAQGDIITSYGLNSNKKIFNNIEKIISEIIKCLENGCQSVGFVSPSHHRPHKKLIIKTIPDEGYKPTFVMNTNAFDKVETIKSLEGMIDIYLPDFKYSDNNLAKEFSDVSNYREIALDSIKEMYKQKGDFLSIDGNGLAISGLIIRHLVLPGYIENSINVLRLIA